MDVASRSTCTSAGQHAEPDGGYKLIPALVHWPAARQQWTRPEVRVTYESTTSIGSATLEAVCRRAMSGQRCSIKAQRLFGHCSALVAESVKRLRHWSARMGGIQALDDAFSILAWGLPDAPIGRHRAGLQAVSELCWTVNDDTTRYQWEPASTTIGLVWHLVSGAPINWYVSHDLEKDATPKHIVQHAGEAVLFAPNVWFWGTHQGCNLSEASPCVMDVAVDNMTTCKIGHRARTRPRSNSSVC